MTGGLGHQLAPSQWLPAKEKNRQEAGKSSTSAIAKVQKTGRKQLASSQAATI